MAKVNLSVPKAVYFSVLADGKFHHSVEEGTVGAVKREYETSDGKKGFKWEITGESIEGILAGISVSDGDYGKQLHIAFAGGEAEDDKSVIVSLNLASNFAEDFLKKLPKIDLDKEIKLVPYSFEDDKGKKKRGITVYQGVDAEGKPVKLQDHYHEMKKVGKKEQWAPLNGYPEIPKEATTWDSDDWKMYYTTARKFLVKEAEKHPLYNQTYLKAAQEQARVDQEFKDNYPDSPNLKDIPF